MSFAIPTPFSTLFRSRWLTGNREGDVNAYWQFPARHAANAIASAGADFHHISVMPREVISHLLPSSGKIFLDGTLGGGGHSELILSTGASVVALDQDMDALNHATKRLEKYAPHFRAFQANFRDAATLIAKHQIGLLDGIIVDLGVSSHQIDVGSRGFSFQQDGPLDMRMNATEGRSAADIVNEESEEELARILWEYGEERHSRRLARAIVNRRQDSPFTTTGELASFIATVIPKKGKMHPATLSFQGLRIAVNDELGALKDLLSQAPGLLKPGGRLVVISFHSLEDRLVKFALQRYATQWLDRPEWPEPRPNPDFCMKLLTRKPLEAASDELQANPRSRSAKLRAAEKIAL